MTGPSNSNGDSTKYFDRARVIMISVIRPSNYMVTEEEAEERIIAGGGSLVLNARCSEVLIFLNSLAFREYISLSIQSLDSDKFMRIAVKRVLNCNSQIIIPKFMKISRCDIFNFIASGERKVFYFILSRFKNLATPVKRLNRLRFRLTRVTSRIMVCRTSHYVSYLFSFSMENAMVRDLVTYVHLRPCGSRSR